MSRVLIIYTGFNLNDRFLPHAFHEGLEKSLLRANNSVLRIIANEIIRDPWTEYNLQQIIHKENLKQNVAEFNPELIISINHPVANEIIDITNCPIAVYTVDSPIYYSFNGEKYKQNKDRYYFFCPSQSMVEAVDKVFKPNKNRVSKLAFATDFKAKNIEQDINIAFIGTHWGSIDHYVNMRMKYLCDFEQRQDIKKIVKVLEDNPELNIDDISNFLNLDLSRYKYFPDTIKLLKMMSGSNRFSVINEIATIDGFHLYGNKEWDDVIECSLPIFLSYNKKSVYSLKDLERIYNGSKIVVSTSHSQTTDAVPWRVRDVMATNGVIVSDARSELLNEFPNISFPTYGSACEAKELCLKILSDDEWRKDFSQQCQEVINKGHRFEHRLKDIQLITGVALVNLQAKNDLPENKVLLLESMSLPVHRHDIFIFVKNNFIDISKTILTFMAGVSLRLFKKTYRLLPENVKSEIRKRLIM